MARGLYGQLQGDERRQDTFGDRILDNQLVEGEHVAVLRRMVTERKWPDVTRYCDKLKKAGHSRTRIDSMLSRAMAGLSF